MVRPAVLLSAVGIAVRSRQLRRVELAWSAVIGAEWAHLVALAVFAYGRGGAAAVGVAGLMRLLPAALLAPFAASLGDRFRRERFLAVVAIVGSGALGASAVGAFAGSRLVVFGFGALVGICTTLVRPALQALLPSLARTPEELVASNGATSLVEGLGTLVGPLAAGLLASAWDVGGVFTVAGGAFLVAGVLFARVRVEGRIELGAVAEPGGWQASKAGFDAIAGASSPRLLVGLVSAQCFVRGCLNVLIVVTVFRLFHEGAPRVGYLIAAIGVGGLLGALGAMTLARRLAVTFGLALVFWGLPIMLIASRPNFAAALLLLAIVGAANGVEDVAVFTLLQRTIPDHVLARALGVLWGWAMGAVALGSIVAPALVGLLGARSALIAVGAILPLLITASFRRLVEIDRTSVPTPGFELIDRVPMLAPLSIAAKERVAARLVPLSIAAGDVLIHSGDAGDRFYIVADGKLAIDAGQLHVAAHAGDYVGEIALLRDVPRTATVTAITDSQLYALRRDDFLAAVTGHQSAHAAGDEVTRARLAEIAHARAASH